MIDMRSIRALVLFLHAIPFLVHAQHFSFQLVKLDTDWELVFGDIVVGDHSIGYVMHSHGEIYVKRVAILERYEEEPGFWLYVCEEDGQVEELIIVQDELGLMSTVRSLEGALIMQLRFRFERDP